MLEIAEEYVERHGGDRIAAAREFTAALQTGYNGDVVTPNTSAEIVWLDEWIADHPGENPGYSMDNAALAAILAFDLTPLEMVDFLGGLLGDRPIVKSVIEEMLGQESMEG